MLTRRELARQQLQLFIQGEKSPAHILDTRHIPGSVPLSAHPVFPVFVSSSLSLPISLHTSDTQPQLLRFPIPPGHSASPCLRSFSLATPRAVYRFPPRSPATSLSDVVPASLQSLAKSLRSARSNSLAVHRVSCRLLPVA